MGRPTTLAASVIGKVFIAVRRLQYIHRGAVLNGNGAIELTFDDGTTFVLDAGGDGEALGMKAGAWVDPFAEPLSDENRLFVERSGKWAAFDMTEQPPYLGVIDHRVDEAELITSPADKIIGIFIRLGEGIIRIEVDSDELYVNIV